MRQIVIRRRNVRDVHAEPTRLHIHHRDKRKIRLIVENWRAGNLLQLRSARDVIDMGVGHDDLLNGQMMPGKGCENAWHLVARIDDDRFA